MPRTELTPQDKEYKKIISATLNELLQLSGKKQIDITRQTGIPASTLTGYFKGTRLPSPVNVQKLADFFNVLKSDVDPRFKKISEENNDGLKIRLLTKYEKLNIENKKKVVDYADKRLKEQLRTENKIHSIVENDNTYYVDVLGAVSAGTGEWLTDEQHEEITVNNEPPMHDFALRVNGDSMIPLFSDGQIIYVNKIDDLDMVRNEQIVIAELNGDAYVKKIVFDNNRKSCKLISLNKEYKPIDVTSDDEFKISGVVVI
ncbi:helix-turn-helix domain-containing protein [Lactobacillus salivarius]|uniref:LexA family transcriptional regulator n=2 Tax=Ligilactobacillus salivarius TaxID=1624 RepID=UPI0015C64B2B|nr:LexA family transcriptional regulator [Ligilactobacillus salivarius]NXZ96746.1 helix-turn-helix domain-containing protein [Ligilactobacillus salivarius]NYA58544.1 helix-turn-helix domain-containing protein [Ligilactobacillus salivarius]NYA64731.1 helix-turn-helix domain-containing protein [Ligilactobacillus salivarius]NYA73162.1 helix-turn-helix domain-containing protein [Ligilactobacillus salivarius]